MLVSFIKKSVRKIQSFFRFVFNINNFGMTCLQIKVLYQNNRCEKYYDIISEEELRACRNSNILFIFGSGYSLNDLTPAEISYIEQHNTLGFNWFIYQDKIRVDYHIIREVSSGGFDKNIWLPKFLEYGKALSENKQYANTVLFAQSGLRAVASNRLIGMRLMPERNRIFRYRNSSRGLLDPPSNIFSQGVVHGKGTLIDAINIGYLLGYTEIVLVGVDLYDRRYFWLGREETRDLDISRNASLNDHHNTKEFVMLHLSRWVPILKESGVELYVYNPRSLLANIIKVFRVPENVAKQAVRQNSVDVSGPWYKRKD